MKVVYKTFMNHNNLHQIDVNDKDNDNININSTKMGLA